jgi:hypothetical protein
VGADDVVTVAALARLRLEELVDDGGRWFARLAPVGGS